MLQEPDNKRSSVIKALIVGFLVTLAPWLVFGYEQYYDVHLSEYGVLPRSLSHLYGIFTMPLLHADLQHILSNTPPLFILTSFLYYFYRKFFGWVFMYVYLLAGFWTWIIGRPDFHIGASGVIYGLTAYVFFSGVWSKNYRLSALSLLIVFLYGSIIWGIFPMEKHVSWEGHMSGFVAGFVLSIYYRKQLPGRKKYDWELVDDKTEYVQVPVEETENGITVTRYIYVPKNKVLNLEDYEPNGMDRS
jgi:membrane associated rhomboid family serine protease